MRLLVLLPAVMASTLLATSSAVVNPDPIHHANSLQVASKVNIAALKNGPRALRTAGTVPKERRLGDTYYPSAYSYTGGNNYGFNNYSPNSNGYQNTYPTRYGNQKRDDSDDSSSEDSKDDSSHD
ncbi:RxLR-like protein [Plasmopara halstedii]|uniref:RxLR-like protein n=1 Tax=Plasmopara halstedii TaxID=4781 RepID=A0A0P1B3R9_PLAHL|nr:RxLR-like protein [Plasmopara halstedii]CEG49406.1 RxLR-like protein [Plasmopara halstedii]|eukprot:XP_024585775.1 RxLR-like protein [Plasmopara halstedii]